MAETLHLRRRELRYQDDCAKVRVHTSVAEKLSAKGNVNLLHEYRSR